MARRIGPNGVRIVIEPGDSPYSIAAAFTGDPRRAYDLVLANPQKPRDIAGGFRTLIPGEKLTIPIDWAKSAEARGLDVDEARGLEDEIEAGAVLTASGWTSTDAEIVQSLADLWNLSVDDVLVTMYEESGLVPHQMTNVGTGPGPDGKPRYWYGGLIGGLADFWDTTQNRRVYMIDETFGWPKGTWETIVTKTPIATQLQAIAQIWDRTFKTYLPKGQTIRQYAERMGVSPAAVIHALNFLPARVAGLQTADSAIAKKPENYYTANAGLDVDNTGTITLRDLDLHGQKKLAELEKSNVGKVLQAARGGPAPPVQLAALFEPIRQQWQSITGKGIVTTVGWNEPHSGGLGGTLLALVLGFGIWYFGRKYV